MAEGFAIGLLPDQLLYMTPREMYACFEGYGIVLRRTRRFRIEAAWLTAMWGRAKRLPKVKQVLDRVDPPKRKRALSPAEMRAALIGAFTQLDAPVIRRKKGDS